MVCMMIVSKTEYDKDPTKYRCVEIKEGKMAGRMMYLTKIKEEVEAPEVLPDKPKKTKKKAKKEEDQ